MPNTKENLIDVISAFFHPARAFTSEQLADHLIANGVTVQEGKPLEAFLHPVVAYEGLKAKYLVFGAASGKEIKNCFVLRPDKDPAAVEALRAYASATDNETLAEDIYNWVGKGGPVQEWIPVYKKLPKKGRPVLIRSAVGADSIGEYRGSGIWFDLVFRADNVTHGHGGYEYGITHWADPTQPPKGE